MTSEISDEDAAYILSDEDAAYVAEHSWHRYGQFVMVGIKTMMTATISRDAVLLHAYYDYFQSLPEGQGGCPSHEELAAMLRATVPEVEGWVHELTEAGWLEIEEQENFTLIRVGGPPIE